MPRRGGKQEVRERAVLPSHLAFNARTKDRFAAPLKGRERPDKENAGKKPKRVLHKSGDYGHLRMSPLETRIPSTPGPAPAFLYRTAFRSRTGRNFFLTSSRLTVA